MELNDIKPGIKVKITHLEDTDGMFVHQKHLIARSIGSIGTVSSYVPGHGGDVWFIDHADGSIGAYTFAEFEEVQENETWITQPPECELVYKVGDKFPSEVICTHFECNGLGEKRLLGTKIGKITFE